MKTEAKLNADTELSTSFCVIVANGQGTAKWGTVHRVTKAYVSLSGKSEKELAALAVENLLRKMKKEIKEGNLK